MSLDSNEPLYIIELGAGSGKFSYFMLKALDEMKNTCDFPIQKIIYVMTDFTEKNFVFWKSHPSLKPYFDRGILDAGIYNAVTDKSIKLYFANKVIEAGSCVNPICIVANYLFDTLYHDIFQVDRGQLKEGLVSTGSSNSIEPDPLEPDIIQRLDNRYKYIPIDSSSYYTDEEGDELSLQRILAWYEDYFKGTQTDASILLPIGAIRALRRLSKLSNGRAIIISGDKGNNNPEQFAGLMDPHIAVHGSFSLMVNYHAIGAWFTSNGGFALHNPQEEASLKVSTFVLTSEDDDTPNIDRDNWLGETLKIRDEYRSQSYPYLCRSFSDSINDFGPNDFFVLQKSIREDLTNPPLRTVIALLKLADWDPDVFFKFRDIILNHAPTCGQKLKNDLCRGIPNIWNNYYTMDADKDIAFEIGRFYYGIRDYDNALKYYTLSITTIGEHHVTFHNQGLCYYSLNQLETALTFFRKAHSLNSEYEKARNWVEKCQREIEMKLDNDTIDITTTTTTATTNV